MYYSWYGLYPTYCFYSGFMEHKIKYHIIQFLTKTSLHIPISVGCNNNIKSNITNTIFLEIMIDKTLPWKTHTEMIITKLSVATFVVRAIKPTVILDTLKMVYHSYFHYIIIYRIICWGNSSYSNSIFKLQQRIIRIIMGVGIRDSCTEFFKIWNILQLISQFIFSILLFIVNNENQFWMDSAIYNINTGNTSGFYHPLSHLTIYQKGPFYMGIKVYNSLPPEIWDLSHKIKKFKSSLKGFLHQHSFIHWKNIPIIKQL